MFKKLQLKTMALLALLLIGAGSAWAETVVFDFPTLATQNKWANGTAYKTVTISPITITAKGGANDGKYYTSDKTWRMYSGGSIEITAEEGYKVTGVSSVASKTFTISDGKATLSLTATTKFSSITVTYEADVVDTRTDIATIGDLTVTSLPYNAEGTFTVDVTPADPSLVNGEDYELSWSSSDGNIIAVDAQSGEYLVGDTKGTVTITATVTALDDAKYKNVTKDFEITVYDPNANDGTLAKPFTVAEAIEATPAIGTSEEYYIKGIVCSFEKASIIADGTNYRYYISDDGSTANKLLVYGGKGLNNVAFANADDLLVGDEVVIYGSLKTYSSHPQVNGGNYIVSLKRKADHGLAFAQTEFDTHPNATFDAPTLTNPNSLTVTYSTSDAEVAAVNATTGAVTIGAKEGTATITATFAGDETYKAGSASYTINVARTAVTLSFSETEVTLKKGDAFEAPTFTKNPADLEGVVFSSSYPAVATVSDAGVIALGEATGTAVITATFAQTDVYKAAQASVTITVNDGDPIVEPVSEGYYQLVESNAQFESGKYLIVASGSDNVAFKSSLATLDATNNNISVTITDGKIAESSEVNSNAVTIDATAGSILAANGQYIGRNTAKNNGMNVSDSPITNSFSITDGNATISCLGTENTTLYFKFNNASDQKRFRYFTTAGTVRLFKYVAGESVDKIDIAVSSAGFATYVSNFDLDYTNVEGLFAYKAQVNGDKISFTKVDKVPAGEGVLLRATNGGTKFTVPTTTSAEHLEDNLFVRGTGEAVASEAAGKKNYILNIVDDKIGFYRAAGQTVATNRAYLSTTVSAARIALSFDDENTTGVTEIVNSKLSNSKYFDLQGRRVAQPTKGLYIVNGKKVVLK